MTLYILGKISLLKLFRFIAFELFIKLYILRNNTELISYFIHLNSCICFVDKIVIAIINILHKPLTKTVRLKTKEMKQINNWRTCMVLIFGMPNLCILGKYPLYPSFLFLLLPWMETITFCNMWTWTRPWHIIEACFKHH